MHKVFLYCNFLKFPMDQNMMWQNCCQRNCLGHIACSSFWIPKSQAISTEGVLVHIWLVEADIFIASHFLWAEMKIILFIHFYPLRQALGRSLKHILDKDTEWNFHSTSNEHVCHFGNFSEIGWLAGLAMPC